MTAEPDHESAMEPWPAASQASTALAPRALHPDGASSAYADHIWEQLGHLDGWRGARRASMPMGKKQTATIHTHTG